LRSPADHLRVRPAIASCLTPRRSRAAETTIDHLRIRIAQTCHRWHLGCDWSAAGQGGELPSG
jgi:hypothetical protein